MGSDLCDYRQVERGGWTIWLAPEGWRDEWFTQVSESLRDLRDVVRESRHARTAALALAGDVPVPAFFKLYRSAAWTTRLKDTLRMSRARRALQMSLLLARDGFHVPPVLAAGVERQAGVVARGFLLTSAVPGIGLHEVPHALSGEAAAERRGLKRLLLDAVGAEIGRFHALGYLHGDLVVTNVLLRWRPGVRIWFLDHDRTRRIGGVLRGWRQRRNLVHLNRHRVAGVHHSDRFRVLRSYARARGWSPARVRREARRIAEKTRRVRRKMDRGKLSPPA